MKTKITLLFWSLMASFSLMAQTDVNLIINHKLGTEDFTFATEGSNNLNVDFKLHRIEYYLSQFTVVHDGGQETAITDLYALINGSGFAQVSLGNLNFTTVEEIKFSVGVDQAANHLDPASYSSFHPLAPKNPSMHWGWTSGYRFVAMEGNAGSNLNTLFEIHALGDANYFEVSVPLTDLTIDNGVLTINLDADYSAGIKDIDVSAGIISHGDANEALTLLQNFQTDVFKQTAANDTAIISGITDKGAFELMHVFPNPTTGLINFTTDNIVKVEVYNVLGAIVEVHEFESNSPQFFLNEKGLFLLKIYSEEQEINYTKVLVK